MIDAESGAPYARRKGYSKGTQLRQRLAATFAWLWEDGADFRESTNGHCQVAAKWGRQANSHVPH